MLNAIFDFNGTMFFDETFQEKAWQQYMTEKLGRRITPEEFQTWVHGRNTGDTLEYFFGRPFTQQEAGGQANACPPYSCFALSDSLSKINIWGASSCK